MVSWIYPKPPFDFQHSLDYLNRSKMEPVDRVKNNQYLRLFLIKDSLFLVRVSEEGSVHSPCLKLEILTGNPDSEQYNQITALVARIFNVDLDLTDFYQAVEQDRVLKRITKNYFGFKPVLTPTIFEALAWAIIGQQVNLNFAFQLKNSLVKEFGEKLEYDSDVFYAFPSPEKLADLNPEQLTRLKFSHRKAEYLIGLTRKISKGNWKLNELLQGDPEQLIASLVQFNGVGRWTAEYVLLKGYGCLDSIPAADIGLRNAIGKYYGLKGQASEEEVREISSAWKGYRGLASFYLWRQFQEDMEAEKRKKKKVYCSVLNSPLGEIYIASTDQGVCNISFGEGGKENFDSWLAKNFLAENIVKAENENNKILRQLEEYFQGERTEFALDFDLIGTPFQKRVWKQLLTIPYGSTASYKEIADKLGNSNLSRAVGLANSKNPIGIVIPCHRVIGTSGELVGYAGGLQYKRMLLDLERARI